MLAILIVVPQVKCKYISKSGIMGTSSRLSSTSTSLAFYIFFIQEFNIKIIEVQLYFLLMSRDLLLPVFIGTYVSYILSFFWHKIEGKTGYQGVSLVLVFPRTPHMETRMLLSIAKDSLVHITFITSLYITFFC